MNQLITSNASLGQKISKVGNILLIINVSIVVLSLLGAVGSTIDYFTNENTEVDQHPFLLVSSSLAYAVFIPFFLFLKKLKNVEITQQIKKQLKYNASGYVMMFFGIITFITMFGGIFGVIPYEGTTGSFVMAMFITFLLGSFLLVFGFGLSWYFENEDQATNTD